MRNAISYIYIYYNHFVRLPVYSICYLANPPSAIPALTKPIYTHAVHGTELYRKERNPRWSDLLVNACEFIMTATTCKALCWLFSLFIEWEHFSIMNQEASIKPGCSLRLTRPPLDNPAICAWDHIVASRLKLKTGDIPKVLVTGGQLVFFTSLIYSWPYEPFSTTVSQYSCIFHTKRYLRTWRGGWSIFVSRRCHSEWMILEIAALLSRIEGMQSLGLNLEAGRIGGIGNWKR